jgi:hypothetical protein
MIPCVITADKRLLVSSMPRIQYYGKYRIPIWNPNDSRCILNILNSLSMQISLRTGHVKSATKHANQKRLAITPHTTSIREVLGHVTRFFIVYFTTGDFSLRREFIALSLRFKCCFINSGGVKAIH